MAAAEAPNCCRARSGATVDRTAGRGGTLGYLDYSHPVFEVFKAPRSGDFSVGAHLPLPHAHSRRPASRVLARFDDGAVAAAERRTGAGRVIVVDVDARRLVDRPGGEAGIPAARPPARAVSRAVRTDRRRG